MFFRSFWCVAKLTWCRFCRKKVLKPRGSRLVAIYPLVDGITKNRLFLNATCISINIHQCQSQLYTYIHIYCIYRVVSLFWELHVWSHTYIYTYIYIHTYIYTYIYHIVYLQLYNVQMWISTRAHTQRVWKWKPLRLCVQIKWPSFWSGQLGW